MKSYFDVAAMGEILIDFTLQGYNTDGQRLFAQNAGGAPANVLIAIQRLGGKTAFLGKVGDDMHGLFLKEVLENDNVNTDGLIIDNKFFTTLAFVSLNEKGERSFSFARKNSADTQFSESELNLEIIKNSKIFHIGSLSLTDEPSRTATMSAVNYAKQNGSLISYDPNYRASLWSDEDFAKEQMRSVLPFVDMMKLSDEETELLTGYSGYIEAARALHNQGVKVVVVTLGEKGAYVLGKDGGKIVNSYPCNVVDTTGAGDSFWGGFLYKFLNSNKDISDLSIENLSEFAKFGNAVAGICVENRGAIPAMPSLDNVLSRMNQF